MKDGLSEQDLKIKEVLREKEKIKQNMLLDESFGEMFSLIAKHKGFNYNFDGMNGLEVINELSLKTHDCKNEYECENFLKIIRCIEEWYQCSGVFFILQLIKQEITSIKMNILAYKHTEEYLQDYIIKNFDTIFPDYKFKAKEYYLKSKERIDILAEEKYTHRDVIIELKSFYEKRDTNKQLISYGKNFNNPILIGINHSGKKLDNIIYMEVEH